MSMSMNTDDSYSMAVDATPNEDSVTHPPHPDPLLQFHSSAISHLPNPSSASSIHSAWREGRYGINPNITEACYYPAELWVHRHPSQLPGPSTLPLTPPLNLDDLIPYFENPDAIQDLYFPNVEYPPINGQPYNLEIAPEYWRGWKMSRQVNLDKNYLHREALSKVAVHPLHSGKDSPEVEGGTKTREFPPVPGQVKMVAGLPYTRYSSTASHFCETVAVFHDQESLSLIAGGKALQLVLEIRQLLVGPNQSPSDGRPLPAVWEIDWQRNNRSSKSAGTKSGSYSLGTTNSEGKGHGLAIPATQFRSPDADEVRQMLSTLVGSLVPIILDASIMQNEFDDLEFRGHMMNIPGQGPPENKFTTSLQLNMSYSCFSLVDAIGAVQGALHVDNRDDKVAFTVFILNFFPRGPDDNPGGFAFPEHALYARFNVGDTMAVFVFRGVSPHGALPGWCRDYNSLSEEERFKLKESPPDRFGLVAYLSSNIASRKAPPSLRPNVGFGTVRQGEESYTNFINDGHLVFGSQESRQIFIGTERMLETYNTDVIMGTHYLPSRDPDEFARDYPILHSDGTLRTLPTLKYHPIRDRDKITQGTKYWRRREEIAHAFCLNINRIKFREIRRATIANLQHRVIPGPDLAIPGSQSTLSRLPQITIAAAHSLTTDAQGPSNVLGMDARISDGSTVVDTSGPSTILSPSDGGSEEQGLPQSNKRKWQDLARGADETLEDQVGKRSSKRKKSNGRAEPMLNSESESQVNSDLEEDEEYEVERITKQKVDVDGNLCYLVRWRGYGPSCDMWMKEDLLQNAKEAISEFHAAQARGEFGVAISQYLSMSTVQETVETFESTSNAPEPPPFDSAHLEEPGITLGEDYDDDSVEYEEPSTKSIATHHQRHTTPKENSGSTPIGSLGDEISSLLPALQRLFDPQELEAEIGEMKSSPNTSKAFTVKNNQDAYLSLRKMVAFQAPILPDSSDERSQGILALYLNKMNEALQPLPNMLEALRANKMIHRMLVKQCCRAYIWAYVASTRVIPDLAHNLMRQVFDTYLQSATSPSQPNAQSRFLLIFLPSSNPQSTLSNLSGLPPELENHVVNVCGNWASLVTRALVHVRACWQGMQAKGIKNKNEGKRVDIKCLEVSGAQRVDAAVLFNPLKITPKDKFFPIPVRYVSNSRWPGFIDDCSIALQDIIIQGLIIPHLRAAAKQVGQVQVQKTGECKSLDKVAYEQGQLIGLGGLLLVISNWLGEGIFTFARMECLTNFDATFAELFRDQPRAEQKDRYFRKIEKGEVWSCRVLGGALHQLLQMKPEILVLADAANNLTQSAYVVLVEGGSTRKSNTKYGQETQKAPKPLGDFTFGPLNDSPAPIYMVDQAGRPCIRLDLVGFLIREAMAHVRKRPPSEGWSPARNLLSGQAPITGKAVVSVQPDHFQPIRQEWIMMEVLRTILPVEIAVGRLGLTHFLIFFAYGGSSLTKGFHESQPRVFGSPMELVIKIHAARQDGIKVDNLKVWGTPSFWFAVEQEGRFTIMEKADKLFAVADAWAKFLGEDRLGIHPGLWTVPKPTWTDTFNFIGSLGVPAFKHGSLALFHLVNTLHYYDLVSPPSLDNVVEFMFRHAPTKGAIRGLSQLGFQLWDSGGRLQGTTVQQAFRLLYEHLDQTLVSEDKTTLHFDVIFVENLLCKLSRWLKALGTSNNKRGLSVGVEAYVGSEAVGQLPIPTEFSTLLIQEVVS